MLSYLYFFLSVTCPFLFQVFSLFLEIVWVFFWTLNCVPLICSFICHFFVVLTLEAFIKYALISFRVVFFRIFLVIIACSVFSSVVISENLVVLIDKVNQSQYHHVVEKATCYGLVKTVRKKFVCVVVVGGLFSKIHFLHT